ncbi:HAMP domain-containing histidine kinase [Flavobacterium azooxidireducens]|uniref:histidine kinase n=1 Tax=Flavobacterium azooxidireducens TaxID=1871076 RepID=A0ABY4KGC9_9FLAO|nr:HAMP domain-containing sensor histidine kinase [Flavobacterium azooxidireducens]UPQ79854.1 HAMP domain-containing histidine kinase [Flavobacterium azooxidireducens]
MLQLIVLLLWYNESVNEKKLDKFNEEIHYAESSNSLIDNASNDFNEAQISLQDYLQFRDVQSLENYFSLLDKMTSQLDTVHFTTDENEKLKRTVNQQKYLQYAVDKLKFSIDSIFKNPEIYLVDTDGIPLKLNKINYKDILDSVEVESHLEADSLARKGLFTRVMNALSGKIEIKKETLKQKVTMKYGKVEESGSVEEQFENVFENSDKHYQQQFQIIKSNYEKLRKRDAMLIAANRNLSDQSKALLDEFRNYFLRLGTESKEGFNKQLTTNQTIRFYSILGIVLIMLVLSVLLFFFTQLAFENERKLLLAQETIQQNLSFKNKIVGMLSHEIRSPLSLISIYSKKVSKKIEDADTKEVFKTIQFTTNSLLVMVNQVLDFSKNENTHLVLNKKEFDLESELNQIINNLSTLVENSGNVLEVQSNVNERSLVNSDATKIHQLLYNIVGNANKFTDNGIIKLTVNSQKINNKQYHLNFMVQDNGRGISETDLKIIFEGFYKGINSTQINDVGTGLGLNLCKEIVELFGGTITVDSKPMQGTKVAFTILVDSL